MIRHDFSILVEQNSKKGDYMKRLTGYFKRSLSVVLVVMMLITSAYATSTDDYDPNATQGSGSNSESITGGKGYDISHQGYRISILSGDQPFPGVEKPVQDIWYSTPPSDIDFYYYSNRLGVESVARDNIINQGKLEGLDIPKAIIAVNENGFGANGIAVREYLLGNGTGGTSSGGSGGTPGSPGGPTINWGGNSPTPTVSTLGDKYDLDKSRREQATNLARYYNSKLTQFYNRACSDINSDYYMTPSEFDERLTHYYLVYRTDILNRFANDGDWGVYGDSMKDYILEILENQVYSLQLNYQIKFNRESQGRYTSNKRVAGAYIIEQPTEIMFNSEDTRIPLAEGATSSGDVPLTQVIMALFSDGTPEGEQKLADDINSDSEFRILLESIVWYYPRLLNPDYTAGPDIGIKVAGTAKNIAEFNLASASLLGGTDGRGMGNLTNKALPKGLMTDKDDHVLNIMMPTDPGTNAIIISDAIASNYGWGTHIYTKGDAGTHTWDKINYPDGTPGPAPNPGSPSTPSNPGTPSDPGDPSDPSDPNNPGNPNGGYNITIIKFYENNNQPESNFTREHNPGTIRVEDEPIYRLVDWFYSPDRIDPPSQSTSYDDTKTQALITNTGGGEETVNVVTPDTTLYLKLVKSNGTPTVGNQEFILKESEVTRAYDSQKVKAGAGWPTGDIFSWSGTSIDGRCGKWIGSWRNGHTCGRAYRLQDSSLHFYVQLTNTPTNTIYADADKFTGEDFDGVSASRSSTGGSDPHNTANKFEFVIWRGKDIPTVADYRMDSNLTLLNLTKHYGVKPVGSPRYDSGRSYTELVTLQLDKSSNGDYETKAGCHAGYSSESTHNLDSVKTLSGNALVEVYHRLKSKSLTGDKTLQGPETTENIKTPYGVSTKYTDGYKLQTGALNFYPYVRMTFQEVRQYGSSKTDVQVLSEGKSTLVPNDYAEAGWYTPNEEESMTLKSQQWSTHQRAVNNGKDWNGKNQVLPGGAIYQLDTQANQAIVQVNTWQTVVEPGVVANQAKKALRDIFQQQGTSFGSDPLTAYTVDSAYKEHGTFSEQAEKALDTLRVVQWVNKNTGADKAWNGGIKILGGGESLSTLGLNNSTGTEDKYYMKKDIVGDSGVANEGDLDILDTQARARVYRLWSDTSGNIYLSYSDVQGTSSRQVSQAGIASAINSLAPSATGTKILSKGQTVKDLTNEEAIELDNKTYVIRNFLSSIERNTGKDTTASWASDGKWYNEAWDGIFVVRQSTAFKVGFKKPSIRSNALDPALCPASAGQSELLSQAHLSQFRMNDKSDAFQNKGSNYIGTFKGKDITLNNMENLYQTKKFYIPNATVQDLA